MFFINLQIGQGEWYLGHTEYHTEQYGDDVGVFSFVEATEVQCQRDQDGTNHRVQFNVTTGSNLSSRGPDPKQTGLFTGL